MSTIADIYTPLYHKLMKEFPLHRIRNRKDAVAATVILDKRFRDRFDDPGEEQYVMILADLLADYEEERDPAPDAATGLDVLRLLVDQHDLRQSDLAQILGIGQSAVSMILSGERPLTADHARRLGKRFGINPGTFI
jgi:HTH-type transcriptional regulator/antitoxin HigA